MEEPRETPDRDEEGYEPPVVEDIEPSRQPSVTAAGVDGTDTK